MICHRLLAAILILPASACAFDPDDRTGVPPATHESDPDAPDPDQPEPGITRPGYEQADQQGAVTEPRTPRRAFVTRGSYSGNFLDHVQTASDGLAAADAICQTRADAAQLGGTWVAWLSSSEVDALDRIGGDGPWQLVDGTVVFANRAQLETEPSDPLMRDEYGAGLDDCFCGRVYIWSGTRAGGLRDDATCADWTDELASGRYGQGQEYSTPTFAWTDYSTSDCQDTRHLLCLEQ